METSVVNHIVDIDTSSAEAKLDSLILKAEKLKGLLEQCNNTSTAAAATVAGAIPPITYTISLGDIRQLAGAPAEAFTPAFLEEVRSVLTQIAMVRPVAPEQPKAKPQKKSLIITPGQA